jgi:DNA-binding response OmpR family regulator
MNPASKKEKILVIEGEVLFGERVAEMLRKDGYTVILKKDGTEGMQAIYDLMPHLIIVDVVLPGTDGYQIIEKKASEPLLAKIPLFLISTQGVPINMQRIPQGAVKEFILDLHAGPDEIHKKVNALFGYQDVQEDSVPKDAKRVLWVEDDKLIGTILAKKLISSGFNLSHAKTGDEALLMLSKMVPDVIVLDLLVPGVNGFDILQRIKATPQLAKVPVMILSNLNKQSDMDRARILGAQKFLVKAAVSLDQIVSEVRGLCK